MGKSIFRGTPIPVLEIRMSLAVKRVYEPATSKDGFRILVDRLWPRGLSKDEACVDLWLKELAPSTALRKWFGHDPAKWEEFQERYFAELDNEPDGVEHISRMARRRRVTLVYGARDELHNDAVALMRYLHRDN